MEENQRLDKPFQDQTNKLGLVSENRDNCSDDNLNNRQLKLDAYVYEKLKVLPKTRFYGSKRRILPWIYENIKDLEFQTVLDGFGGTGSVSLLFKAMGKHVTYNDILLSNTISAKTLLANKMPIKVVDAERFIDSVSPQKGIVYKHFQDIFYTDEENMWIDGAVASINSLPNIRHKNLLMHCLFQACLMKRPFNIFHRANLNLRVNADVTRSFGNLTTWNTPFDVLMKKNLFEVYRLLWNNGKSTRVLKPKPVEKIKQSFDLVYLDPPYVSGTKSGDGYLKKYHFLEGLANYDEWESSLDHDSRVKMPNKHHFIPEWEHKHTFKNMLFTLIDQHKNSIVVLSYANHAVPTVKELSDFFESRFSKVTINTYNLSHALAKSKRNEILIIGEP